MDKPGGHFPWQVSPRRTNTEQSTYNEVSEVVEPVEAESAMIVGRGLERRTVKLMFNG